MSICCVSSFVWDGDVNVDAVETAANSPQVFAAVRVDVGGFVNDNFNNRVPLTLDVNASGVLTGMTAETMEPLSVYHSQTGWLTLTQTLWYSWTASVTRSVAVSLLPSTVTYATLRVFTGSSVESLTQVGDGGLLGRHWEAKSLPVCWIGCWCVDVWFRFCVVIVFPGWRYLSHTSVRGGHVVDGDSGSVVRDPRSVA